MKKKQNYSKISKVGPLFKIEGGLIFKHPFKTAPLKGFNEENVFKRSEVFLQSITDMALSWFENFPKCCESHREIGKLPNFKKKDYEYIPLQILNNTKYFAHALEFFIDQDNGMNEIKDYLDYLIESFGRPNIGGHIFDFVIKHFIENTSLDNKKFSDDEKLELLTHLEPTKPPMDSEERELTLLYSTFQKWLKHMPNIGEFKKLKSKLTGKIPMNIFMIEPRHNKYLGMSSFRSRSKNELLEFLMNMTNHILNLSRTEIIEENYTSDKLLLTAEEKLKISQSKLLQNHEDLEISYLDLVEKWLSNEIEFYKVLSQVIQEKESSKLTNNVLEIKSNVNDVFSKIDNLQIEITSLCNSNKILTWLKVYLPSDSFRELMKEIENLVKNDKKGKEVLDSLISKMQLSRMDGLQIKGIKDKMNRPDISVKHKLKLAIPLFFFVKYEGEIELSDKKKLPKSFKDLKKLFIEE